MLVFLLGLEQTIEEDKCKHCGAVGAGTLDVTCDDETFEVCAKCQCEVE